jgi:hypothetical protein
VKNLESLFYSLNDKGLPPRLHVNANVCVATSRAPSAALSVFPSHICKVLSRFESDYEVPVSSDQHQENVAVPDKTLEPAVEA